MRGLGKSGLGLTVLLATSGVTSASEGQVSFSSSETVNTTEAGHIITEKFSAFAEQVRAKQGIRGLSLGLVRPDGGVEFGAWGSSTEEGHIVDADTMFAIGSCTKAFLAASLGILMDDFDHARNVTALPYPLSTFGWHTKIKDLIPDDWKLVDMWAEEKADLRDILSHVSGQVGHDMSYKANDSLQDVVRRLRYHESPFELRQTYAYNNEMYVVGAYILATYSGTSFDTFAKDRIFKPLGMNATTLSPDVATGTGNFSQAWSTTGRRIPYWFTEESSQVVSGAGAILSTARDMTKWLQMLLNHGVDPTSNFTVIPKPALEAITTASAVMLGIGVADMRSIIGYGIGWGRYSYRGQDVITHTGGLPGFMTLISFLPHTKLGIVSFTNTDEGATANNLVGSRVIEDVLGLSHSKSYAIKSEVAEPWSSGQTIPLSVPLELYTGTYYRPDYENITFCAYPADESAAQRANREGDYCSSLRAEFAIVDDAQGKRGSQLQLIAAYDCIWSKQIRLTHLQSDTFTFVSTTLFTHGFGADEHPFEYYTSGDATARFIIKDDSAAGGPANRRVQGFFACGILRDADEVQGDCMTGEGAQTNSLVWFEKVL